jgi:putative DNA methylase
VLEKVRAEIGDLYPLIPDPKQKSQKLIPKPQERFEGFEGAQGELTIPAGYLTPVAYLWTRTVKCKNHNCGATVPLVRQTWLCKKKDRYVALKMIAPKGEKKVRFEVVEAEKEAELGFDPTAFSKAGNATCPFCETVADSDYVKAEGCAGRMSQQLMVVACTRPGEQGKEFLSTGDVSRFMPDDEAIIKRIDELCKRTGLTVPDEILVEKLTDQMPNYGIKTFRDLFTPRQMLCLLTFASALRTAEVQIQKILSEKERVKTIITYLAVLVDRLADYNSTSCTWESGGQFIGHTFTRQALPLVWDFSELAPFGNASGSPRGALEWIMNVIENLTFSDRPAILERGSATDLPYPDAIMDAVITDPPYYDNIQYASLSDFFYVWLRRTISHLYPDHFSTDIAPKKNEAVASPWRHNTKIEARQAYELMMSKSFKEACRVLKSDGQMTVVYAHKTTLGWATLVDALRVAGLMVTEAWPLDTERGARLLAIDTSALASSIFLVARKREGFDIGAYETDVRPELENIVRERVETLWEMGISGADLVIAAVGAGLCAFTKYAKVEYANGEEVPAEKFLAEVEGVVLETLMEKIFGVSRAGVKGVDGPTQFYVLWRYTYKAAELDAGEAIVFTYGIPNVELDGPKGLSLCSCALVEKKKSKYRLKDFTERGDDEKLGFPADNGGTAPLIDILHRILYLMDNRPAKLAAYLQEVKPNHELLRLVSQALAGAGLKGKSDEEAKSLIATTATEQAALAKLMANWRPLIEGAIGTFDKEGQVKIDYK